MNCVTRGILTAAVLTAAAGLWADEPAPAPADNAVAPGSSGTVSSFAPVSGTGLRGPTQPKVAGRDPASFRRPGTLLAQMSHDVQKVDLKDLADRKRAMAHGERFNTPPKRAGETGSPAAAPAASVAAVVTPRRDEDAWTAKFGWLGWTLVAILGGGVILAWRLGWFVPFSERERSRVSQAASGPKRSRAAKARGPKVELVKRGE